jgi:hypothetical protein
MAQVKALIKANARNWDHEHATDTNQPVCVLWPGAVNWEQVLDECARHA